MIPYLLYVGNSPMLFGSSQKIVYVPQLTVSNFFVNFVRCFNSDCLSLIAISDLPKLKILEDWMFDNLCDQKFPHQLFPLVN